MSELALQLIAENKRTRNTYLDLGRCGLNELPGELFECVWLETLVLSDRWGEKDENGEYVDRKSNNTGGRNILSALSAQFKKLGNLKKLICAGSDGIKISDLSDLRELHCLESLNLSRNKIESISALQQLTNLKSLNLAVTKIEDISVLKNLVNLETLYFEGDEVTDISPLQGLVNLETLGLSGDELTDISPLQGLVNLETLGLSGYELTDISPLQGLANLKKLHLGSTAIVDISPVQGLINLETLNLSHSAVKDISPLQGLTNLKSLDLYHGKIEDLSGLQGLTNLKKLDLRGSKITDISPVQGLTNLESLYLYRSDIEDISALKGLVNLKFLYLYQIGITDISPLKGLTNLESLYIFYNGITDISPLKGLTNLKSLYISGNQIADLSALQVLTQLESLDASGNPLIGIFGLQGLVNLKKLDVSIPESADISVLKELTQLEELDLWGRPDDISVVGELVNLKSLRLFNNQIHDIVFLQRLTHLEKLDLVNNNIADLSALQGLIHLKELDLRANQITDLSPLQGLTHLKDLKLDGNRITDLSPLQGLVQLQYLELSNNQISNLSPLQGLVQLERLDLANNQIADVSPLQKLVNLENLNLKQNQITTLPLDFPDHFPPVWIMLDLSKNPLPFPKEIISQGNCFVDLKRYLNDLRKGSLVNNRVKVVLIGNGSVGKTQVAKRLAEQENFVFDTQHHSTHAIALLHRTMACDFIPGIEALDLTLWDFAGQDIYHATHQLFLQTQAVFVLVWDIENEVNKYHYWQHQKYKNRTLSYWLDYAHFFGENSPVIVVQNKIDRDQGKPTPLIPAADYKNSRASLQLSAKTGAQFFQLEDKIRSLFEQDEQIKNDLIKLLPVSWVQIRTEIENRQQEGIKQMTVEEFQALCARHEVAESAETLFKFFHNTGLFFYKRGSFNDQLILDQQWAIDAVYKTLDKQNDYVQTIIGNQGLMGYGEICQIWKEHSTEEKDLFVHFMLSCELCFEVGENKFSRPLEERSFLIPQFLPEAKPRKEYPREKEMTETHLIALPFLPEVYMQRFIGRAKRVTALENMWRSGVVIEVPPGQCALVEADYEKNLITVRYSPKSNDLLYSIQEELADIAGKRNVQRQRPEYTKEEWKDPASKIFVYGFERFD